MNDTIPPLKLTDSGTKALAWMGEFHVQQLPVVSGGEYVGMIAEYQILDHNDPEQSLSEYDFRFDRPYVSDTAHIYELMKATNEHKLSIIPVLDEDGDYSGLVTLENLLEYFAQLSSVQDPGGIIILDIKQHDYSLTEIAHLVESNNAKIINMYVTTNPQNERMDVTLKIDRTDLSNVIATFERFKYDVKASYEETEHLEDMRERYNSLMNYLNVWFLDDQINDASPQ